MNFDIFWKSVAMKVAIATKIKFPKLLLLKQILYKIMKKFFAENDEEKSL